MPVKFRWFRTLVPLASSVCVLLAPTPSHAGQPPVVAAPPNPARDGITLRDTRHRLDRAPDIVQLQARLKAMIADGERALDEWKEWRKEAFAGRKLKDLDEAELRVRFHPPEHVPEARELRTLREMLGRTDQFAAAPADSVQRDHLLRELQELAAALNHNRQSPVPRMDMFTVPFLAVDFIDNSIGGGRKPATNLIHCVPPDDRCDPPGSTFWVNRHIESQDLYHGFDRASVPDWGARLWEYEEPKTSAGSNPGFEISSGRHEAKVKFAETRSEPLTARIFHALGYHVDPTDHVPALRIRYHRRMLREFHLRRDVTLHFRFIGPPVHSMNLQQRHDPLEFVLAAVLRDGTRLDTGELRRRLYLDPAMPWPESRPDNFNVEFEATIDHLIMGPVNFQPDEERGDPLGPWDYGELGHDDLRELRAAGLLSAWLGWYDSRADNTRLRLVEGADGTTELRHCFADLGGGLGRSDWGFNWLAEDANAFPWEFTTPPIRRGKGRMTTPFRIVRFHTLTDNPAFRAMTEDDARWMARRIGRLSREQLLGALIASGMDAAETTLYYAKLAHRRNRLLADLELSSEFPPLPTAVEDQTFDFDPRAEPPPAIVIAGVPIEAPIGDQAIVGGLLVTTEPATAE